MAARTQATRENLGRKETERGEGGIKKINKEAIYRDERKVSRQATGGILGWRKVCVVCKVNRRERRNITTKKLLLADTDPSAEQRCVRAFRLKMDNNALPRCLFCLWNMFMHAHTSMLWLNARRPGSNSERSYHGRISSYFCYFYVYGFVPFYCIVSSCDLSPS